MKQIEIYKTRPFVILMKSGVVFHLKREQYEEVATAWLNGDRIKLDPYEDPETGKNRVVMLDSFNIEIIDEAPFAQKEHWVKQGGFVCKWDTFHEKRDFCDCRPKPDYSKQKDSGLSEVMSGEASFTDTDLAMKEEATKNFHKARDGMKKEIQDIYNDIAEHIRTRGIDWCEKNRDKWKKATSLDLAIKRNPYNYANWYGLFWHNEKARGDSAQAEYEKRAEEKAAPEKEEVDDIIPF